MFRLRFAMLAGTAVALATTTAGAQRLRTDIPSGQMPPAGLCRVWIDGVPPGRQPRATDCETARAQAPANSRIIYGSQSQGRVSLDPRTHTRDGRYDPRADPRSPAYDPRFDRNSRLYDPRHGMHENDGVFDPHHGRNSNDGVFDPRHDDMDRDKFEHKREKEERKDEKRWKKNKHKNHDGEDREHDDH